MRRNVKFPALMAARPPKHKNPKISVCAFDTVVELAEVTPSEFPVAIIVDSGTTKTDYRLAGGKLYRPCHTDIDRFIKRHQGQCIDSRRGNYVTGHIVRKMYRDVMNINDYSNDRFWPKSALHLLKTGMNTEWKDVREIIDQSPSIDLRGPWLEKVAQIDYMSFLAGDPDQRIARYERMTHQAFSAYRVMDGQVWAETHEPCYVAQMLPEGIGHMSFGNVGNYVRDADTSPDRTWWNHLDNKVFSARDYAEAIEGLTQYARPVNQIEIVIPEALTADIPSLEIDRCARVLAEEVSERMAARSKDGSIALPSTRSMAAWTELMTFVEGYDPFEGVPDEVEDRIAEMLESVEACASDCDLIVERIRPSLSRHLEEWRDRAVDFGFAEARSMRL
ncbi:hypothetical protein OIU34_19300 [Pararhizobium sp. BT-229]|uniref:hypothetical protein n=1 Tax=Pararhizobium sp. BT-229 TaxID=2986923 RepID=UPI0021F7370B|nr:hypothetical protein [Pararhizobium sp. BT-229]MCV9964030.1 hypothetical protein [Pararhizobium sp. BT-229]